MEENKELDNLAKGKNVLNAIISGTFTRHNELSESEYLERLGVKEAISEDRIVKIGIYNILMEMTKEIFRLQQKTNLSAGMVRLHLEENKEDGK